MKKAIFAKALLALGIAVISAVSALGLAGCADNTDKTPYMTAPQITLNADTGKITWNPVPDATEYYIHERMVGTEYDSEVATVTNCEYTIAQTNAGEYDYYVTAIGDGYYVSGPSNMVRYEVKAAA